MSNSSQSDSKITNVVQRVAMKFANKSKGIADFSSGDTVGVYVKVKEGDKERVQLYKGVVIKVQGEAATKTFTVRKISSGIGVERTFPMYSPAIDRVEVISSGKIRRSRLYFLRNLKGKAARLTAEIVGLRDDAALETSPSITQVDAGAATPKVAKAKKAPATPKA
jgi:large subunit ribosomal protein L19